MRRLKGPCVVGVSSKIVLFQGLSKLNNFCTVQFDIMIHLLPRDLRCDSAILTVRLRGLWRGGNVGRPHAGTIEYGARPTPHGPKIKGIDARLSKGPTNYIPPQCRRVCFYRRPHPRDGAAPTFDRRGASSSSFESWVCDCMESPF